MSSAPPLKRVIALLWRSQVSGEERRHPGPRPRLDVDRIVDEAVALADENPSAGVSMRALAGRLGVTPMTLYGYVPDKGTLLASMYDSIHAEMPRVVGEGISGVVDWVEEVVEVYLRHPWAIPVAYGRPILGPYEQEVFESLAVALRRRDLDAQTARGLVGAIFHLIRGTAHAISASRQAQEESGVDERAWWNEASTALAEVVPDFAERFPGTVWLVAESETDDGDHDYVARHSMTNLRTGVRLLLGGAAPGS